MNKHYCGALATVAILILSLLIQACQTTLGSGKGELRLHFANSEYSATKASDPDIPDTSAFLLKVTDSAGKVIFEGTFGNSPESMLVDEGSYNVSVRSRVFEKPEFSAPQYGDDQCVVVKAGSVTDVRLSCSQLNSGIRLSVGTDFLTSYPKGLLYVSSSDGKLLWSYRESRIAYFKPGDVSIILSDSGVESTVFTRRLLAREILSVKVAAPAPASSSSTSRSLSIAVDTSRVWTNDYFSIGSGASGSGRDAAMDVATARNQAGATGVWVYGYIVGAFKSTNNITFTSPFPSATSMAIAARASTTDLSSCFSVELKKGGMREELSLVDNPGNKGRKVFLKGDIVSSYYGIPGIKNVTEWELE